ncbi:hypothetical protein OTSGILL_1184 [Orientia tsutsugamushi str. Gilliam]|uniref:Uncharacterized protein n=1 Tax=Orientia tsutsugamushi str. Gilliam TaxID=1359184 RepID=A0A0F3MBF4_ORITS|nr:hypothetical protein OTSGILL_1184 [Orientia tsutsugamushi str. Gilliam]
MFRCLPLYYCRYLQPQDSLYGGSSFSFHNWTFTSKINSPYLDAPTNYDTLEAGIGYRLDRHRMDARLGFMCHHNCRDNFVQGNYYYNIIEGNKAFNFCYRWPSISFQ